MLTHKGDTSLGKAASIVVFSAVSTYLTATMALVLGLATVPAALRCYACAEAEENALLDINGTDFRSSSGLLWFCCYCL